MSTPSWQPGTLYAPGAIVQPASAIAPVASPVVNGTFESGDVSWTKDAGMTIGQFGAGTHFLGTWSAQWDATSTGRIKATTAFAVQPGQSITASCQVQQGASSAGQAGGRVEIGWYTSGDVLISYSSGNLVDRGSNQKWKQSTVTAVAPATAAKARIVGYAFRSSGSNKLWLDNFVWDLQVTSLPVGLVFKATQALVGSSGSSEPTWPVVLAGTVVDNQVTWEGVYASHVVWQASPVLVSGASEPTFPALADATVADNTIIWTAMRAQVTQAPNSRVVIIAASKVFAADGDITPFSATVNCLDWTTPNDAGYIPNGLNVYGGTPTTALGLYRSNLVIFNSQGLQMWQVDQDPANMAILDAVPIPCEYPDTVHPVSGDLCFLTARGVRSMGIAAASTNLQAGFFGKAIDPLVLAAIAAGEVPFALFYPGAGQYWLFFGVEAFVLTMNGTAKESSWSRYVFPTAVDSWAILSSDLYIRAGDTVLRVDPDLTVDDGHPEVVSDPYFDDIALLLHCNGANTSTVFTDSSNNAMTVTASGGAQVTTTNPKFGTGALLHTTTETLTVPSPNSGPLDIIAGGDFTIEFWARISTFGAGFEFYVLYDCGYSGAGPGFRLFISPDGSVSVQPGVALAPWGLGASATGLIAANNAWHHIAFTRQGSTGRLFVDGTMRLSSASCTNVVAHNATSLTIGATVGGAAGYAWPGAMDEIRVTTGVARYTADFTPSTTAFPDMADAVIVGTDFTGYMAWQYLDFGLIGIDKTLESIELAVNGEVSISIGWDQRAGQSALATTPYTVDGDTVNGTPVPIALTAPSMQVRLTFSADQSWEWFATAVNLV